MVYMSHTYGIWIENIKKNIISIDNAWHEDCEHVLIMCRFPSRTCKVQHLCLSSVKVWINKDSKNTKIAKNKKRTGNYRNPKSLVYVTDRRCGYINYYLE